MPGGVLAAGAAVAGGVALGAAVSLVNPIYAVVGLVAAGVVVGLCLQERGRFWLLAGVITLLPFAVIPVNFGVQLGMLDALSALILGVALVRFLTRTQPFIHTALDLPVLLYIGLTCVSLAFGMGLMPLDGESARYFIKITVAILMFFVLTNSLTTRDRLDSFVKALTLGTFGSAALAVLFQVLGQGMAARLLLALTPLGYPAGDCFVDNQGNNVCGVLRYIAGSTIWRATSTSIDPNIFGGLLIVGMLLLLGRLMARPSRLGWRLGLPALAIMGWALLQSYSRGAWVGLAAGLLVLVVMRCRKALPALLIAGAIAVLALGQTEFGSHLVQGFLVEDRATEMRVGEYQDALRFISEYPVFGVGYGFYSQWRSGIHQPGEVYVGVSNMYLLMALEIGLVGMAGFAGVLGTLAVWGWRRYREADEEGKGWIAAGTSALFAGGVAGLADHYFAVYPHMTTLWWSLVAIVAVAARLAVRPREGPPAAAVR